VNRWLTVTALALLPFGIGNAPALAAEFPADLMAAMRLTGSPQLGSFGPNMRLAADLLERGEREAVLEYFRLCAGFWPRDELKDWAALVEGGRTPDFGANLIY